MTVGRWEEIDTAPKDGTHILGYDGDTMAVVFFCRTQVRSSGKICGWWELSECGSWAEDGNWYPTWWMELPEAPNVVLPK